MTLSIGLIGLGEAGLAIASGLHEEDGAKITGFDTRLANRAFRATVEDTGLAIASTADLLIESSDVIINLTSASVAENIAKSVAPMLRTGQIYTDWNSTNPQSKQNMAADVEKSGAFFVDGAVMAAVPPTRHRTPVLLSGTAASELQSILSGLRMSIEVMGIIPGQASAVKMMRSLLVKGLEALLIEFALGAESHSVLKPALSSMDNALIAGSWSDSASYLLSRTLKHGARRADELGQVAEMLSAAGIEPLLATSGAERLRQIADLPLDDLIDSHDYVDQIRRISEKFRSRHNQTDRVAMNRCRDVTRMTAQLGTTPTKGGIQ